MASAHFPMHVHIRPHQELHNKDATCMPEVGRYVGAGAYVLRLKDARAHAHTHEALERRGVVVKADKDHIAHGLDPNREQAVVLLVKVLHMPSVERRLQLRARLGLRESEGGNGIRRIALAFLSLHHRAEHEECSRVRVFPHSRRRVAASASRVDNKRVKSVLLQWVDPLISA